MANFGEITDQIRISKKKKNRHANVAKLAVDKIVSQMMAESETFESIFDSVKSIGSHKDRLEVDENREEFDMNILVEIDAEFTLRCGKGIQNLPNFRYLTVEEDDVPDELEDLFEYHRYHDMILSPIRLFRFILVTLATTLENMNSTVEVYADDRLHEFKVKRKLDKNPITLILRGRSYSEILIDLVPGLQLPCHLLNDGLWNRLNKALRPLSENDFSPSECDLNQEEFLALALRKVSSDMFEVDLISLQDRILFRKGCAKDVIRHMKHFRNQKRGPFEKLSSHLIKTVVMQVILGRPDLDWSSRNFACCFKTCMLHLTTGIQTDKIRDVFFPLNLLKMVVPDEKLRGHLRLAMGRVGRLLGEDNVDEIFAANSCCFCSHRGSCREDVQNHLQTRHLIRTWCTGGATCTCETSAGGLSVCMRLLGACEPEDREKEFECPDCDAVYPCEERLMQHARDAHDLTCLWPKKVICVHCCKIIGNRCGLMYHIVAKHPKVRQAAVMTLRDKGHKINIEE